jgi:hypothetical protein
MRKIAGLVLLCILPFLSGDSVGVRDNSWNLFRNGTPKQISAYETYKSPDRPNLSKYLDASMKDNESGYYTGYFSEGLRERVKELGRPLSPEKMQDISLDVYLEMLQAETLFHKTGDIKYAEKALSLGEVTSALSPNSYGPNAILRSIELSKSLKNK